MTSSEMNELSERAARVAEIPRDPLPEAGHTRRRELLRAPYPPVVGRALRRVAAFQVAAWDRALRNVRRVQEETLAELLAHAKDTQFGRAHRFDQIRGHDDFVRRVPVGDYDSFSPYIDRMRAGERGLLVPEFIRYFGNSSGSSNHGKSKFLPISEAQIGHQSRAGADMLLRYLVWAKDDEFTRGFTLGLFPPPTMKKEGPVVITSNPALMSTRMPLFS